MNGVEGGGGLKTYLHIVHVKYNFQEPHVGGRGVWPTTDAFFM